MALWRRLAAFCIIMGAVLSPLRAVAATIPMLTTCDVTVASIATTPLEGRNASRCEPEHSWIYTYGDAHFGYDTPSRPHLVRGAGVVCAYDDALELADQCEHRGEWALYDASPVKTAAEGGSSSSVVYQLVDDAGEAVYYGLTNNPLVRLGLIPPGAGARFGWNGHRL
jgi:hypothetical protein